MARPDIEKSQTKFNKELDKLQASASNDLVKAWIKVEQGLQSDIVALANEVDQLAQAGEAITQTKLNKLKRYITLINQTQEQIARYNVGAAKSIGQTQTAAALKGLSHATTYLQQVNQLATGVVNAKFDQLGVGAVKNIVAISRAGEPLNVILNRSYPLAVQGMTDQLIQGVARGINPRVVARNMQRLGLSQGLNHTLLVTRDQMVRSYREASRQQYDKSDVVTAYRRLAAKNDRTCPACLVLDGRIYPTDELMELHSQDRCFRGVSLIKTSNGEKKIEDIKVGDKVWTHRGRWKTVQALSSHRHVGRAIKIKYRGRELVCTPNHEILTKRGWVESQHLTKTDDIIWIAR